MISISNFIKYHYSKWPIFRAIFFILLFTVRHTQSYAQLDLSFEHNAIYDDNTFRNYRQVPDLFNNFHANLGKSIAAGEWGLRFSYKGDMNLFRDISERTFHYHWGGAVLNRLFGRGRHTITFGANYSRRINNQEFNYYDLNNWTGFVNYRDELARSYLVNLGYRAQRRKYQNLSEYSYCENFAFVRFTKFFPTKTTIIAETNIGHKRFLDEHTVQRSVEETVYYEGEISKGKHGRGHGHGNMNEIPGHITDSTVVITLAYVTEVPKAMQWSARVRVAQSLGLHTGISIEHSRRWNPTKGNRYISGQESGYMTDNELFDDRYSFESSEWSAILTQQFPWSITTRLGADIHLKEYPDIPALDLEGALVVPLQTRHDKKRSLWISFQKKFELTKAPKVVILAINCAYINNNSNDTYYQYGGYSISTGLGLGF